MLCDEHKVEPAVVCVVQRGRVGDKTELLAVGSDDAQDF